MSGSKPISPREEALKAILAVRASLPGPRIDTTTWDALVELAWENRTQEGDRREIQRNLRQVLLQASRGQEPTDATP